MRARSQSGVLDTNLLLLWLAGNVDLTLLRTFKRVHDFRPSDYTLLRATVSQLDAVLTTPHVLTETSNFIDQAPLYRRNELAASLESSIERAVEVASPARELARRPEFRPLGLTDTGLSDLAGRATVVTMDYKLYGRIAAQGGQCINFNHLRRLADSGSA